MDPKSLVSARGAEDVLRHIGNRETFAKARKVHPQELLDREAPEKPEQPHTVACGCCGETDLRVVTKPMGTEASSPSGHNLRSSSASNRGLRTAPAHRATTRLDVPPA